MRGVARTVDEKRYYVDILTQLSVVGSAVGSVRDHRNKHLDIVFAI